MARGAVASGDSGRRAQPWWPGERSSSTVKTLVTPARVHATQPTPRVLELGPTAPIEADAQLPGTNTTGAGDVLSLSTAPVRNIVAPPRSATTVCGDLLTSLIGGMTSHTVNALYWVPRHGLT